MRIITYIKGRDIPSLMIRKASRQRESIDENRYYAFNSLLNTLCVMPQCFKPQTAY